MIATAVTERLCLVTGEIRDDDQLIAERFEWRQRAREHELTPHTFGQPVLVDDAVRMIDNAEAPDRPRRRLHLSGERRHHRVEERQRHRRADAAQHGASRDGFFHSDHGRDLLITGTNERLRHRSQCSPPRH